MAKLSYEAGAGRKGESREGCDVKSFSLVNHGLSCVFLISPACWGQSSNLVVLQKWNSSGAVPGPPHWQVGRALKTCSKPSRGHPFPSHQDLHKAFGSRCGVCLRSLMPLMSQKSRWNHNSQRVTKFNLQVSKQWAKPDTMHLGCVGNSLCIISSTGLRTFSHATLHDAMTNHVWLVYRQSSNIRIVRIIRISQICCTYSCYILI